MNTGEPWPDPFWAERRVRRMQAKLHQWAAGDPGRRFDDLYNLIHHPDFLAVAWERVSGNKGARSPGVDRVIPAAISSEADVTAFLNDAREQLKARTFAPLPVRERMIPKAGSAGKFRRLGIPSAMDRLVQAALVLVLEPIFEADFKPVSYGFRPKRRAQDAIAEIHAFGSRNYHWVFEADITACFDELSHTAILDRVRRRVGDKRVLALAPLGLRLSESETRVVHLDEGFVFLGSHIQRRTKAGTNKKKHVYTYPSKKALLSVMAKVRALTNRSRHLTLEALLRQLNPVLRGWCTYFRHGVSKATFQFLDAYVWRRVTGWLRKRHLGITWKELYRRFLTGRPGNRPEEKGIVMFDTTQVEVTRYRWRANNIPTPWTSILAAMAAT